MAADNSETAYAARLFLAASAALGEERAAELREALADRAGQFWRVERAAAALREPPAAVAAAAPGPALIAAASWCESALAGSG